MPDKVQVDPWFLRPVFGKFRVLEGIHSEGYVPGTYSVDGLGATSGQPRVYTHGDIVASRSNLLRHNPVVGPKKYENAPDNLPDKYAQEEEEFYGNLPKTEPLAKPSPPVRPRQAASTK